MAKLSIEKVDVRGKRVLCRVDFNVPVDETGKITDDRRIRMALPTITGIADRGGRVILMSHFGRPGGTGYEQEHSLKVAADALSAMLPGRRVVFPSTDCVDAASAAAVSALKDGEILLLENLRFHKGETKNDPTFGAKLATYGQVYCDDAFGAAHRAHASLVAAPLAMHDAPRAAGLLLLKELKYLSDLLENPPRPLCAILGGAKVSDKLPAITNLMPKVDMILIGGAMAYTFLKAQGRRTGKSLVEAERIDDANRIIDEASRSRCQIFLPFDHVCAQEISSRVPTRTMEDHIEEGWMGLDIGPKSQALFAEKIASSRGIIWNGPMGVFETAPFDAGTRAVANAIVAATRKGAISVIGGGDSAAAVEEFGLADQFSHVSTGGGASLEMLEGRKLPGVEVLQDA